MKAFYSVTLIGPWSKLFRFFVGKKSIGLSILHTTFLRKNLEEKKMNAERTLFDFGRKIAAGLVKTSVHMFMRTVWAEEFYEKFSIFKYIRTLSDKNSAFVRNDLAELWKLHSTCPLEKFGEKEFDWIFFRHWIKSLQFSAKTMGRCCENCIILVHRIFLGIIISFKFFWTRKLQFFVGIS